MKKNKYTPKNIESFIQGYSRYYADNIFGLAIHIKQQVAYRLYICKDTCLSKAEDGSVGRCEICTCPTIQKAYATASCNLDKFPDIMDKKSWNEFMKENDLTDKITSIQEEIDNIIKSKIK